MSEERLWYRSFFLDHYLPAFEPLMPPERTQRDVNGILEILRLSPPATILDLACGQGRHANRLSELGFQVVGLDLSIPLLIQAQTDAAQLTFRAHWVRADMRRIPFRQAFDVAINMWSSFGYLEDEEDDVEVIRELRRSLKPGGLLLMEISLRDNVVRRFSKERTNESMKARLHSEERRLNLLTGREDTTVRINRGEEVISLVSSIRLYTLTELANILWRSGMILEASYGGLDASELTIDSRRPVIVARKPD